MDAVVVHGHGYSACGDEKPAIRFDSHLATLFTKCILIDKIEFLGEPQSSNQVDATNIIEETCCVMDQAFGNEWKSRGKSNKSQGDLLEEVKKVLVAGSPGAKSFEEVLENTMRLRRLFITVKKRYLCIGPAAMQRGDKIFILAGCNFPLILRDIAIQDGQETAFELVGEAYGSFVTPSRPVHAVGLRIQY